jgi:hypothetical protein
MKNLLFVIILAALILNVTPSVKAAVTIIDLQGDKDGFGVGCPIATGLHYTDYGYYWADYREMSDPSFTDFWYEGDKTWTHTYDLMSMIPSSATLELYVAGLADNPAWNANVLFNGINIGTIPAEYSANDLTRILTFNVPIGLLTGSDGVSIDINNSDDGYTIDYSQLTIQTIPAPGAIVLCGFGTALIGWLRKRRTL